MRVINVVYSGTRCRAVHNGVSDQIRTLRAEFVFSSDWEAYPEKTAVFISAGKKVSAILDKNNTCNVPMEVSNPGILEIGVFGVAKTEDGEIKRYPGEYTRVFLPTGASPDGSMEPSEEDVTAYEQMLAEMREATGEADDAAAKANIAGNGANYAASNANSAAARANSAISNAQVAANNANSAADNANSAADNANQEAWNAQVAADRANEAAERAENIVPGGAGNSGKLLYVDSAGNVAHLQLGTGLEIVNGRLCIIGTVTPDEPDNPDEPTGAISFAQTDENTVTVSGVVFEPKADGTVLWRGATFTPGEGNTVIIF